MMQIEVTKNLDFLNELASSLGVQPLNAFPEKPFLEKELSRGSTEFSGNELLFRCDSRFSIAKINSVHNIFNTLHYLLAKIKYDTVYQERCDETFLFHGTKQNFLDGICTFNFDRSKMRTHKFGCGISFATEPFYATHYHHDNKRRRDKVMIIAKVLVGETFEIGNESMTIPRKMCYTSKNLPQTVVVKYDDHTFLPVAIVHYQGLHGSKKSCLRF